MRLDWCSLVDPVLWHARMIQSRLRSILVVRAIKQLFLSAHKQLASFVEVERRFLNETIKCSREELFLLLNYRQKQPEKWLNTRRGWGGARWDTPEPSQMPDTIGREKELFEAGNFFLLFAAPFRLVSISFDLISRSSLLSPHRETLIHRSWFFFAASVLLLRSLTMREGSKSAWVDSELKTNSGNRRH